MLKHRLIEQRKEKLLKKMENYKEFEKIVENDIKTS